MGLKEYRAAHQFDAMFEDAYVKGDTLKYGRKSWPVAECEAVVEQGATLAPRLTATRVVIAGPFALLLKKDRSKVFLAITVPDDMVLVELKAKHEGKARQFAVKLNKAAAHFKGTQPERGAPGVV